MKSERLRKLESEYQDLEYWFKLNLVPKKDIEKHKKEMEAIKQRIEEEKERLRMIKESGEETEYTAPKRTPGAKQALPETHTLPGVEIEEGGAEPEFEETETEPYEAGETTFGEEFEEAGAEERTLVEEEEEEDPFSDRSRWKRGILEDPEVDNW